MTNGFERLLVDLIRESVHFIVVGGLAVAYCGYVRATDDLDRADFTTEEEAIREKRVKSF